MYCVAKWVESPVFLIRYIKGKDELKIAFEITFMDASLSEQILIILKSHGTLSLQFFSAFSFLCHINLL